VKEKILIIQTAFLCDAVLTLPIDSKIERKYPDRYFHVLCIPSTKEISRVLKSVDDVINI